MIIVDVCTIPEEVLWIVAKIVNQTPISYFYCMLAQTEKSITGKSCNKAHEWLNSHIYMLPYYSLVIGFMAQSDRKAFMQIPKSIRLRSIWNFDRIERGGVDQKQSDQEEKIKHVNAWIRLHKWIKKVVLFENTVFFANVNILTILTSIQRQNLKWDVRRCALVLLCLKNLVNRERLL